MPTESDTNEPSFDAIIVGAGFAGLYMLYRLCKLGLRVRAYEAGTGVGGTWYWNRYPGARCDAQSLVYSFSFDADLEQEWIWTERYATQPEILRYLNHVADRFDLRKDIEFNTRVDSAMFEDSTNSWIITTNGGASARAHYLIMASGALSVGHVPDIDGLESFSGKWLHTGSWPHEEVSFEGKRVAVIGTGSSGIQVIPIIASRARHLSVFQRTPAYTLPARNAPLDSDEIAKFKENVSDYRSRWRRGEILGISDVMLSDEQREMFAQSFSSRSEVERRKALETCWQLGGGILMKSFNDVMTDEKANHTVAEFVREKIRGIIKDPQVAAMLCPSDYPIGSKRVPADSGYYETFNRENVTLVDLRKTPIQTMTPAGIRTSDREYAVDVVVFATGFDAVTGALLRMDIRGASGTTLRDAWSEGPKSYLGVGVAGFPNFFTVTGPGSPSVLTNVVVSIEQHVEWIAELLEFSRHRGYSRIEVKTDSQTRWSEHVRQIAGDTIFMKTRSWYLGANIPGKSSVFLAYVAGAGAYRVICDDVAKNGYSGFQFS